MRRTITKRGKTVEYECHKLAAPRGCRRVLFVKPDGECYEVFYDAASDRGTCECRGFLFTGGCKHVESVRDSLDA